MEYVSDSYNERLIKLAELLCTPERLGQIAVEASIDQD